MERQGMSPSPTNTNPAANPTQGPAGNTSPQKGSQGQPGAAPDPAALQAKIQEAEAALQKERSNLQQLRSADNQRDQEIAELRRKAEQGGGGYYPDDEAPQTTATAPAGSPAIDPRKFGEMALKVNREDWRDHWDGIQEALNDPLNSARFARYAADGNLDWEQVYDAAYSEIRSGKLEARLAELEAQQQQDNSASTQQQELDRRRAAISGSGAHSGNEVMDLNSMSDDDVAALVESDPRDPIRAHRSGTSLRDD
jgi:multidrug resistance efflux pump